MKGWGIGMYCGVKNWEYSNSALHWIFSFPTPRLCRPHNEKGHDLRKWFHNVDYFVKFLEYQFIVFTDWCLFQIFHLYLWKTLLKTLFGIWNHYSYFMSMSPQCCPGQQIKLTDIILLPILSTTITIQWNIWGVPIAWSSSQLLQLVCLVIRFNYVHLPTLGPGLDRYIRNKHGHHRSFQILLCMFYCKEVK